MDVGGSGKPFDET